MGVRTDPGYELFDQDCLECFAESETPKKMFVYFSGIELIDPNLPAPGFTWPNTWILEQDAPCSWTDSHGGYVCTYIASQAGFSSISLVHFMVNTIFTSSIEETCKSSFANEAGPGVPFSICQFGRGQVFTRPILPYASIQSVMEKLNIKPHRNTMFEGFPLDATHAIAKYCRVQDSTNVKIKFEV